MGAPIFPSRSLVSKYSIPLGPTIFGKIDFEGTNRISGEADLMKYRQIVFELKGTFEMERTEKKRSYVTLISYFVVNLLFQSIKINK